MEVVEAAFFFGEAFLGEGNGLVFFGDDDGVLFLGDEDGVFFFEEEDGVLVLGEEDSDFLGVEGVFLGVEGVFLGVEGVFLGVEGVFLGVEGVFLAGDFPFKGVVFLVLVFLAGDFLAALLCVPFLAPFDGASPEAAGFFPLAGLFFACLPFAAVTLA